jgi:signal transduction histidine kinase
VKLPGIFTVRGYLSLIVLCAILPALALLLHNGMERKKQAIRQAQESNLTMLRSLAVQQQLLAEEARGLLSTLASIPSVRQGDIAACKTIFEAAIKNHPAFVNILLTDVSGNVLISALPVPAGVNLSERKQFKDALGTQSFSVGEYTTGISSPRPVLPFAHPVLDAGGKPAGTLMTGMRLDVFASFIERSGIPPASRIGFLDRSGVRLYNYPRAEGFPIGQKATEGTWKRIFEGPRDEDTYVGVRPDGLEALHAFVRLRLARGAEPYLHILTSVSVDQAHAGADAILQRNIILLFLAAALALIISHVIGKRLFLRGIAAIVGAARSIQSGNLAGRLGAGFKCKEFNQLAGAFNEMAGALETRQEELSRSAAELSQARSLLGAILDAMPSGLVGLDGRGMVTHINPAALKMAACRLKDPSGRPLADVFPWLAARLEMAGIPVAWQGAGKEAGPPAAGQGDGEKAGPSAMDGEKAGLPAGGQNAGDKAWLSAAGPGIVRIEGQRLSAAGEERIVDVLVYPVEHEGGAGAVVRLDDVTKSRRMAEVMVQTEKMMSVGGLAAGMAHEINNPLGGILQGAQVIGRRLDPFLVANVETASRLGVTLDDVNAYLEARGVTEMLGGIRESGARAAAIVANMLEFSRVGGPERSLQDVSALLDKAVELAASDYDIKKKYDFKQIRIVRQYGEGLPPVECGMTQIEQVFFNILKNAAQAMAGRQARDDSDAPEIRLKTSLAGEYLRVDIADNGPGMPEEVRKRVFEPFFTTKKPGQGTGLGLSVSYFIVTANHGGSIHVESAPGEGTRFVIHLPLKAGPVSNESRRSWA